MYTIGGIAGALLALNVLRLLVFCLCWFFGTSPSSTLCLGYYVWIFPNLNNEKLGVVDSFFPLISCEVRFPVRVDSVEGQERQGVVPSVGPVGDCECRHGSGPLPQ